MRNRGAPKHSRRAFLLQVTGTAPTVERRVRPDPRYGALTHAHDEPIVTPNADFFTASISDTPRIDPARWTLTIDGLVENPLILDWEAVRRLPAVEAMQTIACIDNAPGNSLMGNATWRGLALKPLLARAGVKAAARRARCYAADGYSTGVDLWWLGRDDAMLAYAMNGAPLPAAHGYPLRLLVPGLYGQKMPKWITRIELIDHPYAGYWEQRGWPDVAAVKTRALFRSPPPYARVSGMVYLQGVAYAGDRAITEVKVRVDEGPWLEATLARPKSPAAWTTWHLRWEPNTPGVHTFRVHATDARGFTQSGQAEEVFPAGTGAIDRLVLIAVDHYTK